MLRSARLATAVLVVASTFSLVGVRPAGATPAPPDPTHLPPVEAPVADPFRPPADPYASGNRGIEYATEPGAPVRATAGGEVLFAGPVGGALHVTVEHPDGVRTSYSFLERVEVVVGQPVEQGQVIGRSTRRLHLGARLGDAYFDPAALFAPAAVEVHLIPFDVPLPGGVAGERSALRRMVGGLVRKGREVVGDAAGATVDWLREGASEALDTASAGVRYTVRAGSEAVGTAWDAWHAWRQECTEADVAVPPPRGRRVAVLVGGLGSTSTNAAIDDVDTAALGYGRADVLRFSYRGGRTPDATDGFAAVPSSAYGAGDTTVDLHQSAVRLADLVEQVVRQGDGATVDLLAHSQGGLVARLALAELARRNGPDWVAQLGAFVTLGTPHGGTDLATAAEDVGSTLVGDAVLEVLGDAFGHGMHHDDPSIRQMAEGSELVRALAATPPPEGVDVVAIAARGDLVVPVPHTDIPGAPHVVVDGWGTGAHDRLPGSSEATREIGLALAGMAPTCQGLVESLADHGSGRAISMAEDVAAEQLAHLLSTPLDVPPPHEVAPALPGAPARGR
ncbi:MAG: peptidoglycan DD-metalloendopeptidase family protein [Acidimicrobiia bacterium]